MKAMIDVADREERHLIEAGLHDPVVRAFVKVSAVLDKLPSDRARNRVLTFVRDTIDEERGETD
jgi:hypothetical protein